MTTTHPAQPAQAIAVNSLHVLAGITLLETRVTTNPDVLRRILRSLDEITVYEESMHRTGIDPEYVEPCWGCGTDTHRITHPDDDGIWCSDGCRDDAAQAAWEARCESAIHDYWGRA